MPENVAREMKARLRADLTLAMKAGRKAEAVLIRELIGAIDNAEAAPDRAERASLVRHDFRSGSAEGIRRSLDHVQLRNILLAEIEERESGAVDFERLGESTRAEALQTAAAIARRYLAE